jgi:hypothetical protein
MEAAIRGAAEAAVAHAPDDPSSPAARDSSVVLATPQVAPQPSVQAPDVLGAPHSEGRQEQLSSASGTVDRLILTAPTTADDTPIQLASTAPSTSANGQVSANQAIARAMFTSRLSRLEPVDDLGSSLPRDSNVTTLYFFTELRGLKGARVKHAWYLDDRKIFEIPIKVTSNRFRASSNKRLSERSVGHWQVRVLDGEGNVLHTADLDYR